MSVFRTMYLINNTNYLNKTSKPSPRQTKIRKSLPDDSSTIIFCRGFPNEDVPR